ncbi:MAG TPA: hypothetical protein VG407_12040 [Caulobacteraceae bacterium]|jgi:MYXO-CTERM domain-containing protein|nr:hypothetical protein [Caulobacteraceae bacterium]
MALPILALVVFCLFVLQRFGVLREHRLSWDLTWRIFLNILTTLGVVTVLVKLWSVAIVTYHLDNRILAAPTTDPPAAIASAVVLALGLIGVWRRRKWGAYVVLGRLVLVVALQAYAYRSLGWDLFRGWNGAENVTANLVSLMLWTWAFACTWKHFGHSDYGRHAKRRSAALPPEEPTEVSNA